MSDLRAAAQQALEALEFMADQWGFTNKANRPERWQAIAALRAALAQQEQEPVANASTWFALVMNAAAELEDASHFLRDKDAKRVAISAAKHYRDAAKALYTHPPRREWVSLTDDEISALFPPSLRSDYKPYSFARAIEQALKEKNQ